MPIRVLVVDDDERERIVMRYLLEQIPDVTVVGEVKSGLDALLVIKEKRPDLVFIDIVMPGLSGLETAHELKGLPHPPLFAFVTRHPDQAVHAFELEALDYIVKPVAPERLARTVERAKRRRLEEEYIDRLVEARFRERVDLLCQELSEEADLRGKLPVKDRNRVRIIDFSDIICIASDKKRVTLYTSEGRLAANYTLNELESRLDRRRFLRVHQAFIVNIDHIREIEARGDGSYIVYLNGCDREVVLARSRAPVLKERLGL